MLGTALLREVLTLEPRHAGALSALGAFMWQVSLLLVMGLVVDFLVIGLPVPDLKIKI